MSFLRRRIFGDYSVQASRESTPEKNEETLVVSASKLKRLKLPRQSKRRNGLIFGLGGLFGILVAAYFANRQDVINFEGLLDMNLDSILDVIPAGIIREARDITVGLPSSLKEYLSAMAEADTAICLSNMSAMLSTTIPSLLGYTSKRKASKPTTRL